MSRRSLGRALLGLAVLASPVLRIVPAVAVTSLAVKAWTWTTLPGADGVQVHSTRAVTVSWAGGVVTAGVLRLPMPAPGERIDAPGNGWGVAARRAAR